MALLDKYDLSKNVIQKHYNETAKLLTIYRELKKEAVNNRDEKLERKIQALMVEAAKVANKLADALTK